MRAIKAQQRDMVADRRINPVAAQGVSPDYFKQVPDMTVAGHTPSWLISDPGEGGGVTDDVAAVSYKVEQRRQWDAVVEQLRGWWPTFEGFMAPVTQAMVDHSRLYPGARVVDVASGFGEPALTVARLVGPGGRVVATDLSPAMLGVAGERAGALGLGNVECVEMDAEEPTLPPGSFDAVVCRLGLMFLPHLKVALDRLAALLVPGGRLVAAVWGPPEANPWLSLALRTLVEYLELPPPHPEAPWLFGLGGGGVLEDALARAGLEDVHTSRVALRCGWPSAAAYTAFHQASPLRRLVEVEQHHRRAQAWQEVTAAASHRWGHGPLHLPGEIVVVSGCSPGSPGEGRYSRGRQVPQTREASVAATLGG